MAPRRRTVADRFWEKVDKSGPIPERFPEIGPCWLWTAAVTDLGYGYFMFDTYPNRRGMTAHRAAWTLTHGEPSADLFCCHKCDNPRCVNPAHLFLGTQNDNMQDKQTKGRCATGDRCGSRTHPEKRPRGERHHKAKLTRNDVLTIRRSSESGPAIASRYGISRTTVSEIRLRKSWQHVQE